MKILLSLGSILVLGPIFGLCGTVIGMLRAFEKIEAVGAGQPELLAEDISFALVTTQIGMLFGVFGVAALIIGHILTFRKEPLKETESEKEYIVCMLLNLFLGAFGAHHFYTGRIWLGFAYIFTLGGFIVGNYSDFIRLAWGNFKDSEGNRIRYKSANQPLLDNA